MKSPSKICTEERAVSPVVGVALLIAIAVILAAVVGSVVLGLGTSGAEAPQASLSFENSTDEVTISHNGGDSLSEDNIVVRGDNVTGTFTPTDGQLNAGETTNVPMSPNASGTVSVVWQDPESNEEIVIGSTTL